LGFAITGTRIPTVGRHRTRREDGFHGFGVFPREGNRSLRDHRINSSKQIPLAGEGEIARQNLSCRRTSASAVPVRGRGWRERQPLAFSVAAQTEMDSIAREIDRSRGDRHFSGAVLGRTPDSPGAKRQTGSDVFAVSAATARGSVDESGKCSFSSTERGEESADSPGDELSRAPGMPALTQTKIMPESRRHTEPGVCGIAASIATVQKRLR
jgi:hypothetical protein